MNRLHKLAAILCGLFLSLHMSAQPAVKGQWAPAFAWPNAGIHVHILPTGKVLFWGRREWDATKPIETLDPRDCTPRIWDPQTGLFSKTPKPGFNLFCSGHSFLPDGRLMVVGGHIVDSQGEPHATIYDPVANSWTRVADMNAGRWYPTAITLADGRVMVGSGSVLPNQGNNSLFQIFDKGNWQSGAMFNDIPLYPRLHVAADGRVFLSGYLLTTQLLDTKTSLWTVIADSEGPQREYGSSVLYDTDKVLIVGGGLPPVNTAQVIDLAKPTPTWQKTGNMQFPRRHHNATLLPDGTVLVTGGTSGNGGNNPFNDLSKPVFTAELWNPTTGKWTQLADESVPRLYHSTTVLLPDGRVLSTGGGEYRLPPANGAPGNPADPKETHRDAQLFSPPYLFRGERPKLTQAPAVVNYGQTFTITTPTPSVIKRVSWVRLSSATHAFNSSQRINVLPFTSGPAGSPTLSVTAPANSNLCPPGHYMLFIFNEAQVPSVAQIIQIK